MVVRDFLPRKEEGRTPNSGRRARIGKEADESSTAVEFKQMSFDGHGAYGDGAYRGGGPYGGGYGGGGGGSYRPNQGAGNAWSDAQHIEEENEELTSQLRNKVKTLKSLTIDIGNEVRNQNTMLGNMDDDMSKGGNLLERSMKRLGAMSRSLHNYHTPILFAFVFFVFLLLWLALKFR